MLMEHTAMEHTAMEMARRFELAALLRYLLCYIDCIQLKTLMDLEPYLFIETSTLELFCELQLSTWS
jgi:hypothetical protein